MRKEFREFEGIQLGRVEASNLTEIEDELWKNRNRLSDQFGGSLVYVYVPPSVEELEVFWKEFFPETLIVESFAKLKKQPVDVVKEEWKKRLACVRQEWDASLLNGLPTMLRQALGECLVDFVMNLNVEIADALNIGIRKRGTGKGDFERMVEKNGKRHWVIIGKRGAKPGTKQSKKRDSKKKSGSDKKEAIIFKAIMAQYLAQEHTEPVEKQAVAKRLGRSRVTLNRWLNENRLDWESMLVEALRKADRSREIKK